MTQDSEPEYMHLLLGLPTAPDSRKDFPLFGSSLEGRPRGRDWSHTAPGAEKHCLLGVASCLPLGHGTPTNGLARGSTTLKALASMWQPGRLGGRGVTV